MAIKQIAANTFVVPNTTAAPQVLSTDADPTTGAGLSAPLGSLALRTDVVGLYLRTGVVALTEWTRVPTVEMVSQIYTATGAEGTDFQVTLDTPQAADTYEVFAQGRGMAVLVGIDLPNDAPTDRTTTEFRVITTGLLTAGDKIAFLLVPQS